MNPLEFPLGVHPLDIYIRSIKSSRITTKSDMQNGITDMGRTLDNRTIDITLYLKSYDTMSYRLLRDEIYNYLTSLSKFYIVEDFNPGKRYMVYVPEDFIPQRGNQREAYMEVKLETIDFPYGESIGRSTDLDGFPASYDQELWGYGMGLSYDLSNLRYTIEATPNEPFRIYNPGVEIHPFENDFNILISEVIGSGDWFRMINLTNNTRMTINRSLNVNDNILYEGSKITINDLMSTRDTDRKFIELSRGWNNFRIYNCSSAKITFDTRFYYY